MKAPQTLGYPDPVSKGLSNQSPLNFGGKPVSKGLSVGEA